ncbi:MAG: FapA family protein [Chitinivibrionales bacterium]
MLIEIEQAKPGMTLLEDVHLPSGAILVNGSQKLTESLIQIIAKRGITKIQIVPEDTTPQSEPEEIKQEEEITAEPEEEARQPEKAEKVDALPTLPKVTVVPSKDLMSVKLCVEPLGAPNEVITFDDIVAVLHNDGVVFGIDDTVVLGIVEKWRKFKRYYEFDSVAKGTMPQPAREGSFDFLVKYVSDPAKMAIVIKSSYSWQLSKYGIEFQRVEPGKVIAQKQKDAPCVPGRNVKGDSVPITDVVKSTINLDQSVQLSNNQEQIISRAEGIAYYTNNTVGAHPINFDGSIDISISPDRMKADAVFHPPGEGGQHPYFAQVESLLRENKVVHGILTEEITKVLSALSAGAYPSDPVTVALGTPVKNGENGAIRFLFSLESSLKPKVNPNGTVDYKNVDLVVSVKKGQELAKLGPPTKGTPGTNVLGQSIPAIDGVAAKLPAGANTVASPADPTVLIAGTDGNVKYNGTVVEISEGFTIKGNVDFSTGNIRYAKSVIVEGDVTSGFKVECGGDLQVRGCIEDAEILVGGNVLCKLGYIGQGKGVIDAKGDVNLNFTKNQVVKCRQNVVVAKEALNSTIYARKTITVHGNPLSIAGGKMMARDSITAYSIGNNSGIKSLLEVGTDYALLEELQKVDALIAEIAENKRKLLQTYQKYERLAEIKKQLAPKDEFMFSKLKATLAKFDQQNKVLEDRKKIVTSNIYEFKNASIKIEHAALSGTVFKIGTRLFQVKDEIIGPKTVKLVDEEIRIY